jgi:hypothetical protein
MTMFAVIIVEMKANKNARDIKKLKKDSGV